jgi:hypothetical protein
MAITSGSDIVPAQTPPGVWQRLRRRVLGNPRNLRDRSLYHQMALTPVLAWIGLGADALSSSAYGPEEAFKAIGEHTYLAVALAIATALTVGLISAAYSALVENFPNGGGYGVASKLLGEKAGLVSGSALLVDYALTITTSIAAAGDAVYSFMPASLGHTKLGFEVGLIVLLTVLNLRGVRESILVLAPMFMIFLVSHAVLIGGGIIMHVPEVAATTLKVEAGYSHGLGMLGWAGMFLLLAHAYSLGGGTYTGIEAVSNALPLMREPRVKNAQRTMVYLAVSLALTAGGLLLCYLLWGTVHQDGQTMNAVLAGQIGSHLPGGGIFVVVILVSEATLLIVAAQAGFLGGPRVLANMAVDSWLPHGFASLSERLTTGNGVVIMAGSSLAALLYTEGNVDALVVMYSINVFLTFSLTMAGMVVFWFRQQGDQRRRRRRLALFSASLLLCVTILVVTACSKFLEGGWVTMVVTGGLVAVCVLVRWHYRSVGRQAAQLYAELGNLPLAPVGQAALPMQPGAQTAAIMVGSYGGLGIHTLLTALRTFPKHYQQVVFLSVGVMDSGTFKGEDTIDELRARTQQNLDLYVRLATAMGLPAASRLAFGTDAVDEAEHLCVSIKQEFHRTVFFAGRLLFEQERFHHRVLHNNTAYAIQKRLQWLGIPSMVVPARITTTPRAPGIAPACAPAAAPAGAAAQPPGAAGA